MKKFTLLISLCFLLIIAPIIAGAQNNDPIICQETTSCYSIGYVAVFPSPNSNPATTTIELQMVLLPPPAGATCEEITQVKFTPTFGEGGTFEGDQLPVPGSTEPVSFIVVVNSRTFEDNTLHVMISGQNGPIENFFLEFTEDCGFINPLPVELTSFKGKATESGIDLRWETASELNNSHFKVERSTDGKSFESIGMVQGHGTTSVKSNYSFQDKLPQNGTNYYRLKQVDYDNTQSYSGTIAVRWNAGDAMQAAIMPNPCANRNCNMTISNAANQPTLIQLKDIAGRVVFSKTIRSNSHLFEMPMNELPKLKGLYFLIATTGDQVVHQRVVLE